MKKISDIMPQRVPLKKYRNPLNMPKRQPCPICKSDIPQARNVVEGAFYKCTKCRIQFFQYNSEYSKDPNLARQHHIRKY